MAIQGRTFSPEKFDEYASGLIDIINAYMAAVCAKVLYEELRFTKEDIEKHKLGLFKIYEERLKLLD